MSAPSNVIDFVVNQVNGVTGLADLGLESVPNQYIQPPEERLDNGNIVSEESIPTIDFTNWDDPEVAESIYNAATNQGFSPHAEATLEWKDHLQLVYASEEKAKEYWPAVCRDQALEYMKCAEVLIRRLLKVLLKKLNVKDMDKAREHVLIGVMTLAFNYYTPCPNPELVSGIGRHSDISSITVLLQDEIGGLYVRASNGDGWIYVPPVEGALVINIGDVLQIMSNDRYKSIEHRVVANRSKTRISLPIFVNPAPDAIVAPFPEVLENGEEPKYRQLVYSDYFKYFFSKPHDGKKTIEFAKI
ncbi:hypothetical protein L6164_031333 [Bauhinia variegata]|uniref:Uncharacterized protein n=1 Tax=Bauhinia variegata TaxID=167791 RepID=A0ACB9LFH3_BAUVA|nr:hypothetical protein L6164_031333 [Bauhinia variegata]